MVDSEMFERTLDRMCAEYLEMPGLCLTLRQARRLWGLDEAECQLLLDALIECGFLRVTRDAIYKRVTDGPVAVPRRRPAKASLRATLPIVVSNS